MVTNVSCDCTYNKSEKCKHMKALIMYINTAASRSKTDFEQSWGKPSAREFARDKYSKGNLFEKMFPLNKGRKYVKPVIINPIKLKKSCAQKLIMEASAKNDDDLAIELFMHQVKKNIPVTKKKEDCKCILEKLFQAVKNMTYYSKSSIFDSIATELLSFYNENVVLTDNQIMELCCDTITQSRCKRWIDERMIRISSSSNVHAIKSRRKKTIESLISDFIKPSSLNLDSTTYGIKNEPNARALYENLYQVKVIEVGVIVFFWQPWLCTSLDGIVIKNGIIIKIVEFKCPSSCSKKPIIEQTKEGIKINVKYLEIIDGKVCLKKSDRYYTQVQVQMYITGISKCDLFVFSPVEKGSINVSVLRDEAFIMNVILKSEEFYFLHYLSAVKKSMDDMTKRLTDYNNNGAVNIERNTIRSFTGINIANTKT